VLSELPEEIKPLKIGKGRIVREGNRVAILSIGTRLEACMAAADLLALEGVSATVADARFAKPLDCELLRELVEGHQGLVIVEEGVQGGFGSAVMMWLANRGLLEKTKVRSLTMPDSFIEQASAERQYQLAGLDARSIADVVMSVVK
ncbi:MAG: 1-deoxy-D-xylulose-5-phosphate synthase, partial [Alphaproteobacteria bacterium]|nr:1-deoxy-D-xylulose-5-phosphate synthase [Alphaproteobacteria bacterium]